MKHLILAFAVVAGAVCAPVFAQMQPSPQTTNASPQIPSNDADQSAAPHGQTITPKTRAQVYQELVQAEHDGQLATLNSTVYAGQ